MAKVMFFCPTLVKIGEGPSDKVVWTILNHLKAHVPLFNDTGAVAGFQTDLDWSVLKEEQGVVAVVVFDANDACIFGVSLEAQNAGLPTYELVLFGDDQFTLCDCSDLQVVGKLEVSVEGQTPL